MLPLVIALAATTAAAGIWCLAEVARDGPPRVARGALALLGLAVLAGVAVRLLVPAHHAMYVDEPWYAEAACHLARTGELVLCETTWEGTACAPYGKAWGWPVLLAPLVLLFGCQTWLGIALSRALGTASVLLVAIAARGAGGTWWQGAFAAALLALHPVHVAWSVTGETNVAAAATLLAGLCGALRFVRTGRASGAVLAIGAFGLSTAIRPEGCLAAAVVAAVLAVAGRAPLAGRLVAAGAVAIVAAAMLAAASALWAMNASISDGAFLSAANVPRNLRLLGSGGALAVHGIVVLTAAFGAVRLVRRREWAATALLFGAALAGALAVLAYDRFGDRMLLAATVALVPLSGIGLAPGARAAPPLAAAARWQRPVALAGGLAGLAVVAAWVGLLWSAPLSETQRLETRIATRVGTLPFPEDALFIAAQPTVLAAAGRPAVMATRTALADRRRLDAALASGRPVYFLCDMFCEPGFQAAAESAACHEILRGYALAPVAREALHGRAYALYRLTGTVAAASTPPACPRNAREHEGGAAE